MKLKTQIFLSIFSSGFLMLSVIGVMFFIGFKNSTYALLEEYNKTSSEFARQMVYNNLDDDQQIDQEELNDLVLRFNEIQFGDDGYIYIMNTFGQLIIHPALAGFDVSDEWYIKEMIEKKNGSIRYIQTVPPDINREKQVYYRHIPELDWIVVSGPFLDEVQEQISKALRHLSLSLIVVFIINLLTAYFLTKTIYSPIKKGSEQLHMLIHRIDSKKLKSEIGSQVNKITGYDAALDQALNKIKKSTNIKKHT